VLTFSVLSVMLFCLTLKINNFLVSFWRASQYCPCPCSIHCGVRGRFVVAEKELIINKIVGLIFLEFKQCKLIIIHFHANIYIYIMAVLRRGTIKNEWRQPVCRLVVAPALGGRRMRNNGGDAWGRGRWAAAGFSFFGLGKT
jgi:hypothetical protein